MKQKSDMDIVDKYQGHWGALELVIISQVKRCGDFKKYPYKYNRKVRHKDLSPYSNNQPLKMFDSEPKTDESNMTLELYSLWDYKCSNGYRRGSQTLLADSNNEELLSTNGANISRA